MDAEDSDTHLCLTCHSTIIGLLNYVNHKKNECPGRKQASSLVPQCDNLITLSNAVCNELLPKNVETSNDPIPRSCEETVIKENVRINCLSDNMGASEGGKPGHEISSSNHSTNLLKSSIISTSNQENRSVFSTGTESPLENPVEDNCGSNSLHNPESSLPAAAPPIGIEHLFTDVLSSETGLENDDNADDYVSLPTNIKSSRVLSKRTHKSPSTVNCVESQENQSKLKNDVLNRDNVEDERCNDFFLTLELQSKTEKEHQSKSFTNTPRLGSFFSLDLPISAILDKLEFESDEENDNFNHMIDFPSSDEESFNDFDEQLFEDRHIPPKSHTGGKWKPGECPKTTAMNRLSRSSGKWKPGSHPSQYDQGKWQSEKVSSQNKSKFYTCDHCDISFVNRFMFSNHCRSKDHKSKASKNANSAQVRQKAAQQHTSNDIDITETMKETSLPLNETGDEDILKSCDVDNKADQTGICTDSMVEDVSVVTVKKGSPDIGAKEAEEIINSDKTQSEISEWKSKPSKQSYNCEICNKTLYSKYSFARHLLTRFHYNRLKGHPQYMTLLTKYHGLLIPLSPFQCLICQYFFNREEDLLNHISGPLHKKECRDLIGPMMCLTCKYNSVTHDDFLGHMYSATHKFNLNNHHKLCIVKEKHYKIKCKFCGKVLHSIGRMKRHMYVRHSDGLVGDEVKRNKVRATPSCTLCGVKCPSQSALTVHLRRKHTKEKPYNCTSCNRAFFNQHQLSLHKKSIFHQRKAAEGEHLKNLSPHITVTVKKVKEKVFKCEHCDFTAYSYPDLRPHYMKVHSSEVMNCELCDLIFLSSKALHVHHASRLHQENLGKKGDDENIFTCSICNKKYGDIKWFNFHMELTHNHINSEEDLLKQTQGKDTTTQRYFRFLEEIKNIPKTTYIKCPQCHKDLQKEFILEHLRIHTGERPFKCKLCGASFLSGITLRRHIINHVGLQTSKCKICGKTYKKIQSYKLHMKEHTEGANRSFQCEVCGQGFHLHSQLRHHLRRHGERKFKCPYENCEWSFVFKSELKFHLFSHTQEKPFLCDMCGFSASTKTRLSRHKKTHSGERNFHCEYCAYKAGTRTHLRRHMRIHIGAKPYKCPYCEYTCNTHENMRKHIQQTQKHKGKPVYPCKFCEHGSDNTRDFRNHLLSKHADEIKDEKLEPLSIYTGLYNKESDPRKPLEGSQIIQIKERRRSVPKPRKKHVSTNSNTGNSSSHIKEEELPKHIKPVRLVRNQMVDGFDGSTVIKKDIEYFDTKEMPEGVSDFINEQTRSCRDLLRTTSEFPPNPKPIRKSDLSNSGVDNPEIQIILTQNEDQQAIMVIADPDTGFQPQATEKPYDEFTQLKQAADMSNTELPPIYQHIYPVQQEYTVITSEPTSHDQAGEQATYVIE